MAFVLEWCCYSPAVVRAFCHAGAAAGQPPWKSLPRGARRPRLSSARQAAANSTVPVSQRAALRLVQELGKLGPNDKITPEAAARLIKRFDEPLSEADILTIARLTNLDITALKIAAGVQGPEGAAIAAE